MIRKRAIFLLHGYQFDKIADNYFTQLLFPSSVSRPPAHLFQFSYSCENSRSTHRGLCFYRLISFVFFPFLPWPASLIYKLSDFETFAYCLEYCCSLRTVKEKVFQRTLFKPKYREFFPPPNYRVTRTKRTEQGVRGNARTRKKKGEGENARERNLIRR